MSDTGEKSESAQEHPTKRGAVAFKIDQSAKPAWSLVDFHEQLVPAAESICVVYSKDAAI